MGTKIFHLPSLPVECKANKRSSPLLGINVINPSVTRTSNLSLLFVAVVLKQPHFHKNTVSHRILYLYFMDDAPNMFGALGINSKSL